MKTDIIIIGSGPGGYRTAEYAAHNGLTVTIIEEKEAGGTCLNCGCIPTKTLCHHAEIVEELKESEKNGLLDLTYHFDYTKVKEHKEEVIAQLRSGIEQLMQGNGITFVRGHAEFSDAKTVMVNGEAYTADNIIIATGSHSKMLPVEGIDQPNVVDSTKMLDINEVPKRLCIVGAGVIGLEIASVFSSFGSEVTVIEFLKECLPTIDSDVAKRLRQSISKRGVIFHMQSGLKKIDGNTVYFDKKGKEDHVEADLVLIATGRGANVDGLGLDEAGVTFSPKGIEVDDNMQTNVPGIYAIGDVNARCMLAHAATSQGLHAVNHILGRKDNIKLDIMPAAIFTNPEAASVGLSEDQCKTQGIAYTCKKGFYRSNGKALSMNRTEGLIKLLAAEDGTIIGCHGFGAHSADMVQEVSTLMCSNAKVQDLSQMVHIHPTLGEILQDISMAF